MLFLIWSFEHDGWWAAGGGYCNNADKARRFGLEHAEEICRDANNFGEIKEAIVPFNDAEAIKRLKFGRPFGANMPGPHIYRDAWDKNDGR